MRRTPLLLLSLLALIAAFFPAQARAISTPSPQEAINAINSILGTLEGDGIVPPSLVNAATGEVTSSVDEMKQNITDVENIILCIDTAKNEVVIMQCLENFKDTYVGQMLLAAVPSWFWDLLDVYIDIRTVNIIGLIAEIGEAAVCAGLQVLLGGTDLCGILGEFINIGEDMTALVGAVYEFFKDIGKAAYDYVKCKFKPSSCGDHMTGQEIAWRDFFESILVSGEGIKWRISPPFSNMCMAAAPVGGQAASYCPQDFYQDHLQAQMAAATQVIHTNGNYSSTHDDDIVGASRQFQAAINEQWDAQVMDPNGGYLKLINDNRKQFINTRTGDAVHAVFAAGTDDALKSAPALTNFMTNWCSANFGPWALQQHPFANQTLPGLSALGLDPSKVTLKPIVDMVDFWITEDTDLTAAQKAQFLTTADWCKQGFYLGQVGTSMAQSFLQHLVSDLDCKQLGIMAPAPGSTPNGNLWCPTLEAQTRCRETLGVLGLGSNAPVKCGVIPQCPVFNGEYYCSEGLTYQNCVAWAHDVNPLEAKHKCGFDTSGEGTFLAQEMRYNFSHGRMEGQDQGPPSKYAQYCTIDGKAGEVKALPEHAVLANKPAGAMQNQAGLISGQVGNSSHSASAANPPLSSLVHLPHTNPVVLDCPRPTQKHFCDLIVQKYQIEAKLPVPLVSCTADHLDPNYQKLVNQVQNYAHTVGNVRPTYDPLVLNGLVAACPQGFSCVNSLQPTIDGVDVPTILLETASSVPRAQTGLVTLPGQGSMNSVTTPQASTQQPVRMMGNVAIPTAQQQQPAAATPPNFPLLNGVVPNSTTVPPPSAGNAAMAEQINQAMASNLTGVAGYNQISNVWKNLPTLPAPTPRCGCQDAYNQIMAINQKSENLIKAGDNIAAALSAGKVIPANIPKANQGLDGITTQLRDNLKQRRSLVPGYIQQLNGGLKLVH